MSDQHGQDAGVAPLLAIMRQLRDPKTGCPWDRQQTLQTLIPYTLEEAYEVADAIEQNDMAELKAELGDLLFQIVFYAQLAEEQHGFNFQDVVDAICEKMTRRHPHVFADASFATAEEQTQNWELIKQQERQHQQERSPFAVIPTTLPALSRARKIQAKAKQLRFDWAGSEGVFAKLDEEIGELKQALTQQSQQQIEEELGDVLFTCVNLARHLNCDPETALRQANRKFTQRMELMLELMVSDDKAIEQMSPDEMENYWNRVKS